MTPGIKAALIMYYIAISVTALITALYDRYANKNSKAVTPRNIIILSLLGGAFWFYTVFLFTKHRLGERKIMILLPVFIILHTALITLMWLKW